MDAFHRAFPSGAFTAIFNVTGQPAISLPLHWTEDGVPVGVQLVAPFGREDLLIRVAAQLERSSPGPSAASGLRRLSGSRSATRAAGRRYAWADDSFAGVITAMVTPFGDDGEVDLSACPPARPPPDRQRLPRARASAGTTGESPTLADDEKLAVARGRSATSSATAAQLIVGTGSNDTRHSVELTARAGEAGADGRWSSPRTTTSPIRPGLRAHFAAGRRGRPSSPIVLYNIPSRCVINVAPHDLAELGPRSTTWSRSSRRTTTSSARSRASTSSPATTTSCSHGLEIGGSGGILVASHLVGPQMRAVCDAAEAGDLDRAARARRRACSRSTRR